MQTNKQTDGRMLQNALSPCFIKATLSTINITYKGTYNISWSLESEYI